MSDVQVEVCGPVGLITLNRPKALNALSLAMVRDLTTVLLRWRGDSNVEAVAIRGMSKHGAFGAFCAGGDIRFFHQAALAGNPELEDFFTEEYSLNHLIFTYPKPYIAMMDGIVMGGGMGISQGAKLRIVTETTKMAMPETHIGLFPDVGGGYFLSRCPGHLGEYLALTGQMLGGADAVTAGLADVMLQSADLPALWEGLARPGAVAALLAQTKAGPAGTSNGFMGSGTEIDACFGQKDMVAIVVALEQSGSAWAQATLATLRTRSPLMLHVVLEQVRRAREMTLADDLRMERDMVRHCFQTAHLQRTGADSETVEGIRALAVDKDHAPCWNPARLEDVTPDMVMPFFDSPWPAHAHPLARLGQGNCAAS
jgi:enoyl-CoA hydratase/carnithine racemase